MEGIQLDSEVVKQKTIEIVKNNKEWNENETLINVTHLQVKYCEVYLIQINSISSTMLLSQNWPKQFLSIKNIPIIFAFRADCQTSGRGQKQNTWQSPQGNLYLTLLFKLQFSYFPYLPLIAISNVFKTIKCFLDRQKATNITKIKWINDILIDFQKVSGVLIRNEMIGQNLFTQIGIGINVKKSPQNSQSFSQSVTFLQKHTKSEISVKEICLNTIETITQSIYNQNFDETKLNSKKIYQENLAYLKKDVLIYDFKYQKLLGEGVFKGINEYGHAILGDIQKPFVEGRMKVHQSTL